MCSSLEKNTVQLFANKSCKIICRIGVAETTVIPDGHELVISGKFLTQGKESPAVSMALVL